MKFAPVSDSMVMIGCCCCCDPLMMIRCSSFSCLLLERRRAPSAAADFRFQWIALVRMEMRLVLREEFRKRWMMDRVPEAWKGTASLGSVKAK